MESIKSINRYICYIPFVWVVSFFTILLFGILTLAKIPVYGIDQDPYSLSLDWLSTIGTIASLFSYFTIPTNVFLTIHLLVNKANFTRIDKIALLVLGCSILCFFLLKYVFTNVFNWVLD